MPLTGNVVFKLLVFTLVLLGAGCAVKPALKSLQIVDEERGHTISYYLERSSKKGAADLLLLVLQGSDCNSVTHSMLAQDAKLIAPNADILYIEKPGIDASLAHNSNPERPDCPKAYLEQDTPLRRAQDAERVLAKLHTSGKYKNMIAVGGSEGALVAVVLAAQSNHLDAAVSINGGGRFFIDDVLHNIEMTSPPEKVQEDLEGFKGFAEFIQAGEPSLIDVSNHGYQWWHVSLSLDQSEYLQAVSIPMLLVQAESDKNVSAKNAKIMVEEAVTSGNQKINLLSLPGLDHALLDSQGESQKLRVYKDIRAWIVNMLATQSDSYQSL